MQWDHMDAQALGEGKGGQDFGPGDEHATRGRSRQGSCRVCPWLRVQPSLGTLSLLRNPEFACKRRKGILDILAGPGVHPLQTPLNANNGCSICGQIEEPLVSLHMLDHEFGSAVNRQHRRPVGSFEMLRETTGILPKFRERVPIPGSIMASPATSNSLVLRGLGVGPPGSGSE